MAVTGKPRTQKPDWQRSIDEQVATLTAHKREWAETSIPRRVAYLLEIRGRVHAVAERWVDAGCRAKGIDPASPTAAEEWLAGPWALLYGINCYVETLRQVERHGTTRPPGKVRTRRDGQVVAEVFPADVFNRLLFNGVRGEVWMQPGITAAGLTKQMAAAYKQPRPAGAVALVLGAGNVASIAPMDVLHKLLTEHSVVLLKMNPVNDYLGPLFEEAFKPLIDAGFVAMAYGGADVGAHLAEHPGVEEIHMTGSARTHDAIVFGTGPEGEARRAANQPVNVRRMSSELGNVTPLIVVPGSWDRKDVRFQAENIVSTKVNNSGHNCIGTQVLVLPAEWELTQALLAEVERLLESQPRAAYYPGAADRVATMAGHARATALTPAGAGAPHHVVVKALDPANQAEACFRDESFASVLAVTELPGADPGDFLRTAVKFCNETLWGTLGASVLVDPKTRKALGTAFDDALADLRYGSIGVNIWSGIGFALAPTTWGAFPGHALNDVQSGIGWVHNTYLFDRPQKSVVYGPFAEFPRSVTKGETSTAPKPPWFVTNRASREVARRLVDFEADRSWKHIPGLVLAALRS